MIIAYGLISRELYRGIQFELGQNTESTGETQQKAKQQKAVLVCTDLDGIYIFLFSHEAIKYIKKTITSYLNHACVKKVFVFNLFCSKHI